MLYTCDNAIYFNCMLSLGLEEVSAEISKLDINFHLLDGSAEEVLPKFVNKHKIGAVVCDFSPLRGPLKWVDDVKNKLSEDVPLIQVDTHNIVPCWTASVKLEYGARTIRNKINSKLDEYLTEFPPVVIHPFKNDGKAEVIDWEKALETRNVDKSIGPCDWAKPGTEEGLKKLYEFCTSRLKLFSSKRNDPLGKAISDLSPWFHFGKKYIVYITVIKIESNVICVLF